MALTGSNTEQKIWNFLKAKGLNDYGIAGLMGNLQAESALRPENLQNSYEKSLGYTDSSYTAAVDNGSYTNFVRDSAGYGLAQWTYWSRKQALLEYARAAGASIGDLEMQLGFLYKELSEGYKAVLSTLKTATSVLEASNAVLLKFERPANQGSSVQAARAKYGQAYYDKYAAGAAPGGGTIMSNIHLHKLIFTENACYKAGKTITVKGIMVHSTGANNPWLKRYVGPDDGLLGKNAYGNHWNQSMDREVCVHGFVGKLADGTVASYQTLPWNMRGWHAGGSANNTHIGFEICEDGLTDATYFKAAYEEAVALCAYLCSLYNLDPMADGVIIGHYEGCKRGVASNHGDPANWFPKHGKSMDTLRADVKALLSAGGGTPVQPEPAQPEPAKPVTTELYRVRKTWKDAATQKGAFKVLANAKSCADQNAGYSVFDSAGNAVYAGKTTPEYATYTVVKGDSLWKIAAKQLGKGARWPEIKSLNGLKSNTIYAGQVLKLPAK